MSLESEQDIWGKVQTLDEESQIKFNLSFRDVLESPQDYPEIYCSGIDHVHPNEKKVAELLYKQMFGTA
jgi:hypothetical protein